MRAQGGGGPYLLEEFNPTFSTENPPLRHQFTRSIEPPQGVQPQLGGAPESKPEVRCYVNPVPDLNSGLGQVGKTGVRVVSGP